MSFLFRQHVERDGSDADSERIFEEIAGPPPDQPREVEQFIEQTHAHLSSMTPEERAASDREHDDHAQTVADDRLVVGARGYAMSAWNITHALECTAQARGDPVVIEAIESLGELAGPIASKVARAVSAALYAEELDAESFDEDADGSAKVARLAIDESRRAWRVLSEGDRGMADGVPAAMLRVLDELDAQLTVRFPDAMAFVRPGFDTDDPP
jgi:hypothetical protein